MNKKIFIPIIFFILLLGSGSYFFWICIEKSNLGFISFEEFAQRKVNDEIIIEHKETDFEAKIPKDYQLGGGVGENSLLFVSSDFQPRPEAGIYSPPIPQKGCATEIEIKREKEGTDYDITYSFIKSEIDSCLESPEKCDGEIIEVSGYKAFKNTFIPVDQDVLPGKYVRVQVPKDEIVYSFTSYLFSEDKERCAQEFDNFLEIVSIK
jgi:hypothetical protein